MKDSLKKLVQSEKQLAKLSDLSSSYGYETFEMTGNSLPEIWCPKIKAKIKAKDLPDIGSKKIININGGTP